MKVKLGGGIGMASGSVGNWVFSHNRGGSYVRARVKPTTVNSSFTDTVRNRLAAISIAWGALTDAKRDAWSTWGLQNPVTDRIGDKISLSGHMAYQMLNNRILSTPSGTAIDVPPIAAAPTPLTAISCAADIGAGNFNIVFAPTPSGATISFELHTCLLDNPAQNYYGGLWKRLKIWDANAASGDDIESLLVARYGTVLVGQKLVFRGRRLSNTTGLVSGWLQGEAVVVSTV